MTPEQLLERRKYIGASEIGAILGLSPHATAADIIAEKKGLVTPWEGNDATRRGNRFEEMIIRMAEEKLMCQMPMGRQSVCVHKNGIMRATIDAIQIGMQGCEPLIVQAKSSILVEEWGDEEDGDNGVPPYISAQCQAEMACAGPDFQVNWVAILLPDLHKFFDFRLYRVRRNEEAIAGIEKIALEFWERYVVGDERPEGWKPSESTIRRMIRVPNKVVSVPAALVDLWQSTKAAAKLAKDEADDIDLQLKAALGDSEGATTEDGRILTYYQTERAGYTVQPTTYRTLRLKAPKKGK